MVILVVIVFKNVYFLFLEKIVNIYVIVLKLIVIIFMDVYIRWELYFKS